MADPIDAVSVADDCTVTAEGDDHVLCTSIVQHWIHSASRHRRIRSVGRQSRKLRIDSGQMMSTFKISSGSEPGHWCGVQDYRTPASRRDLDSPPARRRAEFPVAAADRSDSRMTPAAASDVLRRDCSIGARHDHDRVFAACFHRNHRDAAGAVFAFGSRCQVSMFSRCKFSSNRPAKASSPTRPIMVTSTARPRRRDRLIGAFAARNLGR